MFDEAYQQPTGANAVSSPRPCYRVLTLSAAGLVLATDTISAPDAAAALGLAREMVRRQEVELWDGLRFIEHFDVEGWGS